MSLLKRCTGCGEHLPQSCFYKNRSKSDGLATECKSCDKSRLANRYKNNREAEQVKRKENYQANIQRYKERARAWERNNPDRKRLLRAKYRERNREKISEFSKRDWALHNEKRLSKKKEYRAMHPEKVAALVRKRQARKINATPKWADMEVVEGFYAEARRRTIETGIAHHVDHIYPLQSPIVCGLHNEFNLRVIPARENQSKSNKLIGIES
ncbi:TPA: hypothetical protein NOE94_003118 [Pseudomonas aeruginosa]|nr:hypothetical protein [Pseudomonas aeruginosa]